MEAEPKKKVPRVAAVAVTLGAFGLIVAVASFLWMFGRGEGSPQGSDGDPEVTVEVAGQTFQTCTDCHQDLDKSARESAMLLYTHEAHFATGVSDCTVCHPAKTHLADETKRPTMDACFLCHGVSETAIAPGSCSTCHPPGMRGKPPSHDSAGWVPGEHAQQALENSPSCLLCHNTEQFCTSCHGIEMPHPLSWAQTQHAQIFFDEGGPFCENCHEPPQDGRNFCDSCHHPEGPNDVAWRSYHPSAVKEADDLTCFGCHEVETCAACHVRGEETFEADRQKFESAVQ